MWKLTVGWESPSVPVRSHTHTDSPDTASRFTTRTRWGSASALNRAAVASASRSDIPSLAIGTQHAAGAAAGAASRTSNSRTLLILLFLRLPAIDDSRWLEYRSSIDIRRDYTVESTPARRVRPCGLNGKSTSA